MKNIKKAVACLLLFSVCFCFCSCDILDFISSSDLFSDYDDISEYTKIDEIDFEYSKHYKQYNSKDSYSQLENDDMRKLYDELLKSVYYVHPDKDTDSEYKLMQVMLEGVKISQAQIRLTIKALKDDNPAFFWLSDTFAFLENTDDTYTTVQLYSRYSPAELTDMISKLEAKVNGFYASLESNLTPYQLELRIHDFIIDNCVYNDEVTLDNGTSIEEASSFNPYGVLVENLAVCEGYSRAFQLLCHGVNIPCINLIGKSEGELHMWSAVELDNDWYYVDTTWDDNDDESMKYDYFNITQKQLLADHSFSELASDMTDEQINGNSDNCALTSNFSIPDCTHDEYNYYVREAPHLTDYGGDEVINSLMTAATKKAEYFHIYIDPDEFTYEYAVDSLFYQYPQHFFDYVNTVNHSLPDYSIDDDDLSFYKKDTLSVVTVMLSYV
ncbi:MAG: hypothetical protein Q4A12_07565 [Eubacteriales bacterium]|nr:hypothetical protein [Eubacteriales bacterium]